MESPMSASELMPILYVGQHESNRAEPVTDHVLRQAQDCNYDTLTTPITTAYFQSRVNTLLSAHLAQIQGKAGLDHLPTPLVPPLTPVDTPLSPSDTISQLLAVTSPWIDLASPDPLVANISWQVFNQEIAYAAFCGVGNVIVQGPKLHHGKLHSAGIAQYARAISEAINIGPYLNLQILLPLVDDQEMDAAEEIGNLAHLGRKQYVQSGGDLSETIDMFGTWDAWNVIRSVCKYNPRVSIALSLPREILSTSIQSRWYSEPVRLLVIPGSSFQVNKRGQEALTKVHRALITRFMRLRNPPWLLLSDVGPIPGLNDPDTIVPVDAGFSSPEQMADPRVGATPSFPTPAESAESQSQTHNLSKRRAEDPTPHLSYIRWLQRNQPPKSTIERFGSGYQDYLQAPLQPLTDNLESITYEVFEKDPIKYDWYEQATAQALTDWIQQRKSTSSVSGAVVVAVVGAGRGPLVTRALRASQSTGVPVEMYAVEKNPNAYVLLQRHNELNPLWGQSVTVVKSDMRSWKGPLLEDGTHGHVDILISELLGSFGDNELSPECLDGVQHVLNPTNGLSIPSSYTAHITPIAAPKLYADILSRSISDSAAFETPYVVMLHAIDYLSTVPSETDETTTAGYTQQPHRRPSHTTVPDQTTPSTMPATAPALHPNDLLLPDVQTCWSFTHPLSPAILTQAHLRRGGSAAGGGGGAVGGDGANEHNARFCQLTFRCQERGVCHGLGGYFEAVLYEGSGVRKGAEKVELSTNPRTMEGKSGDMISWFPIFFPLKTPLYIPENAELQVSMWRMTDDRKVWYEWLVESFVLVGRQRVRLGASELHSSRKNGCLM